MRIYEPSQNGKLYLSPYTNVIITDRYLEIIQTVFMIKTQIFCSPSEAEGLVGCLREGVSEEQLTELLRKTAPSVPSVDWIEELLRMGILE